MFWDTMDFFTDSQKIKRVKSYRRKSNYYESKSDSLSRSLVVIDHELSDAKSDYGLGNASISGSKDNILTYRYYNTETSMHNQTARLLSQLENQRNVLKQARDEAQRLYREYYNFAIREDE